MKEERDYVRDLVEIRSMMERSSRFLSLSGWAGVLAGIYALAGVYLAYVVLDFNPEETFRYSSPSANFTSEFFQIILLSVVILVLAIGTAIFLSYRKGKGKGEKIWNATSKTLLAHMAVPLVSGGILILILISKGLIVFAAPLSLIFYGIALYNASKFTFEVLKYLGLIQIILGLISACYTAYALLFWALGFGLFHIIYGAYMHWRYER